MTAQFDVGLVVTSQTLSLSELTLRLQREPQSGSHDKGAPRPSGAFWTISVWRENARDSNASLEAQCLQILKDVPPACMQLVEAAPDDVSISLDIAVFFEDAYLRVQLPSCVIGELAKRGIGLEVTGYPACFEA
jgi:hypothetical protein